MPPPSRSMKSQDARSASVFDFWYGAMFPFRSLQSVSTNARPSGLWPAPIAPNAEVSTTRLTPASREARKTRRLPSTAGRTHSSSVTWLPEGVGEAP